MGTTRGRRGIQGQAFQLAVWADVRRTIAAIQIAAPGARACIGRKPVALAQLAMHAAPIR
eukprot:4115194-Pleurochrysis_carterae.AAC.1